MSILFFCFLTQICVVLSEDMFYVNINSNTNSSQGCGVQENPCKTKSSPFNDDNEIAAGGLIQAHGYALLCTSGGHHFALA